MGLPLFICTIWQMMADTCLYFPVLSYTCMSVIAYSISFLLFVFQSLISNFWKYNLCPRKGTVHPFISLFCEYGNFCTEHTLTKESFSNARFRVYV